MRDCSLFGYVEDSHLLEVYLLGICGEKPLEFCVEVGHYGNINSSSGTSSSSTTKLSTEIVILKDIVESSEKKLEGNCISRDFMKSEIRIYGQAAKERKVCVRQVNQSIIKILGNGTIGEFIENNIAGASSIYSYVKKGVSYRHLAGITISVSSICRNSSPHVSVSKEEEDEGKILESCAGLIPLSPLKFVEMSAIVTTAEQAVDAEREMLTLADYLSTICPFTKDFSIPAVI